MGWPDCSTTSRWRRAGGRVAIACQEDPFDIVDPAATPTDIDQGGRDAAHHLVAERARRDVEPEHTVDAAAIPVDANETTVVRLAVDEPFAPSKTLQLDRWYATDTAVNGDGNPVSFEVKVESSDAVESARLIVGVHRRGGVTEPLVVDMNGTPITVNTGDANEFTEFFAPLDATVPVSMVRGNNKIDVTAQDGTTITSVQLVTHRSTD